MSSVSSRGRSLPGCSLPGCSLPGSSLPIQSLLEWSFPDGHRHPGESQGQGSHWHGEPCQPVHWQSNTARVFSLVRSSFVGGGHWHTLIMARPSTGSLITGRSLAGCLLAHNDYCQAVHRLADHGTFPGRLFAGKHNGYCQAVYWRDAHCQSVHRHGNHY
jgi:hypothetical protein